MNQPYDASTKLTCPMSNLDIALRRWEIRLDDKPQPEARRAANIAMDSIDSMLAHLHQMRSQLLGELRDADDATAARVDALLAETEKLCDKSRGIRMML
jgi:hypothetical protein